MQQNTTMCLLAHGSSLISFNDKILTQLRISSFFSFPWASLCELHPPPPLLNFEYYDCPSLMPHSQLHHQDIIRSTHHQQNYSIHNACSPLLVVYPPSNVATLLLTTSLLQVASLDSYFINHPNSISICSYKFYSFCFYFQDQRPSLWIHP